MTILCLPIPVALDLVGLASFVWSLRAGRYEDLSGAAHRVLPGDGRPLPRPRGGEAG